MNSFFSSSFYFFGGKTVYGKRHNNLTFPIFFCCPFCFWSHLTGFVLIVSAADGDDDADDQDENELAAESVSVFLCDIDQNEEKSREISEER